jgi:Vault protein inter-alpha-trypsin domain/von Willebrand factor type A domain
LNLYFFLGLCFFLGLRFFSLVVIFQLQRQSCAATETKRKMAYCESRMFWCFLGQERQEEEVPVRATSTIVALGMVADAYVAKVSQTYTSPTAVHNASFRFPLNDGAAVTEFKMSVNGVVHNGEVKPKQQARNEYNSAVSAGKSAQLMSQKAKDLFEISLGNFGANETIVITFTYVTETSFANGILSLHLPLFSKHRYGETMLANQQDASFSDVTSSGGTVSIIVNGSLATGLQSITSINHDVNVIRQGQSDVLAKSGLAYDLSGQQNFCVSLVLGPQQPSKQDFVLKIKPVSPFAARAVLETDPATGNQAVMLSIMPELPEAGSDDPLTSEILFVCDVSGSMSGGALNHAKEALHVFINSLPVGTAFNIAWFSNKFEFWSKTNGSRVLTEADEAELRADAKAFVDGFQATGGTHMLSPVKAIAAEKPLPGRRRNVIVLTDGELIDEASVMSAIAGSAGNTRWFAIGLGAGASRSLCNGIARNGNGTADFLANATVLNEVVMGLLTQSMQPSVRFSVDWGTGFSSSTAPMSVDVPKTTALTVASDLFSAVADAMTSAVSRGIPDHLLAVPDGLFVSPKTQKILFTKLRETAFCVIDKSKGTWDATSVTVHVVLPNGNDLTFEVPIENIQGSAINALAAHAVISDLEAHDGDQKIIQTIALSRHVISSQTSMLVVNPDAAVSPKAANIRSWQEPPNVNEGCRFMMPKSRSKGPSIVRCKGAAELSLGSGRVLESAVLEDRCDSDYGNPSDQLQSFSQPKKPKNVAAAPPKAKVSDIISANKSGLWSFADAVKYLPAEARVWSTEQKSSDLWVTIAILKLLQQDYVDDEVVWYTIAWTARETIGKNFAIHDIMKAETGLQFSL